MEGTTAIDRQLKTATDPVPKSVLIEVLTIYDWLNPAIMKLLRERYGTRFTLIVGSDRQRDISTPWCAEQDKILLLEDLEAGGRDGASKDRDQHDTIADFETARRYEETYDVNYMLDIVQQDRGVFGMHLYYASGLWTTRKSPDLLELTRKINGHFAVATKLLDKEGIDLTIIRPGGLLGTVLVHVAMARGIPVTMSRPARYKSYVTWAYGPYSGDKLFREAYEQVPEMEPVPLEEILPPEGSRQVFDHFLAQFSLKTLLRELAIAVVVQAIKHYRAFKRRTFAKMPPLHAILRDAIDSWRSLHRLERLSESDIEKICERPFVLFLLPKEPEYTVQSLAREFSNVQAIVQQVALSLPAGYNLVVKEHSIVGFRRRAFYDDILKLPNVIMASPRLPGIELAARSAAVSTIAGTTAVEAALIGKQAIIFTRRVEYSFLPNIHTVTSFFDLAAVLRDALRERSNAEIDALRRCGARYSVAVAASSFDAAGTKVFKGTGEISEEEAERGTDILLKVFRMQLVDYSEASQPIVGDRSGERLQ